MAIVGTAQEIAGRERTLDALAGFQRTYTKRWWVQSDDPTESEIAVSTATNIPNIGDPHPLDTRAYVISKQVQQGNTEAERKKWIVTAKYSTLSREAGKRLRYAPTERPAEVSWSTETYQKVAEKDIDGKGIVNSAGQYFDPPVMADDVRAVLTIVRAESEFNGSLALQYVNTINNAPFFGGAAYTVKCAGISSKRVIEEYTTTDGSEQEFEYWSTTYEFHYKHETWRLAILDQGRYELDGANELTPILDAEGNPVVDPAQLDGSGGAVANPTLNTAVFLTKKVYREVNFNVFNF